MKPPPNGGGQRQEVVCTCFRPLVAWVLHGYTGRRLALALNATTVGDRFVVLAVSVVYRGCAIPVAWTVLRAGWQWQHTRMTDPQPAERLWLAVAVATLWRVREGAA